VPACGSQSCHTNQQDGRCSDPCPCLCLCLPACLPACLPPLLSIGDVMGSLTQKLSKYGICLRGDVSTCIMTISVSEGLLKQLDPSFNLVKRSFKYLFLPISSKTTNDDLGM
jgi:hypothetical protein